MILFIVNHINRTDLIAIAVLELSLGSLHSRTVCSHDRIYKQLHLRGTFRYSVPRSGISNISHGINIIIAYDILRVNAVNIISYIRRCLTGCALVNIRKCVPYHNIILTVTVFVQLHIRLQPLVMCGVDL